MILLSIYVGCDVGLCLVWEVLMKISICIPTYNRAPHLANCLNSIIKNKKRFSGDFQVCVSDNCSTDDTEEVVRRAQADIEIKYHKNNENMGIPRNFLNVVEMAKGEFVWLIGDDDLLLPCAIEEIINLIDAHKEVDFFYINSSRLSAEYVFSFPQPFDTNNLPNNMPLFSSWGNNCEMKFMELVNPKISFDFLGGMFLSVFRRKNWCENVGVLDSVAVSDPRTFSHFDNTFPHIKIFSKAFSKSNAFFNAKPLSVCLSGAREWAPMYPFVHSVRLVEALNEYRNNGLPFYKYLLCRNYALNSFIPDLVKMLINKDSSGVAYVKLWRLILSNCIYPNFYFSFFYFFLRKIKAK